MHLETRDLKHEDIKSLIFLEDLTSEEKELLFSSAFEITYNPDKILVEDGSICQNIYFVIDGLIRIYKLTPDGRELTLYRIGPGEMCLFTMGCIMEQEAFKAIAKIEKKTRLLAVPGDVFKSIMTQNITFQNFMFKKVLTALTELMVLIEEVTFHSINKRVASFLLHESSLHNSKHLKTTHEAMAQELGTAREVISRMLKEFEKNDLVSLSRGKITLINEKKLKVIAEL